MQKSNVMYVSSSITVISQDVHIIWFIASIFLCTKSISFYVSVVNMIYRNISIYIYIYISWDAQLQISHISLDIMKAILKYRQMGELWTLG